MMPLSAMRESDSSSIAYELPVGFWSFEIDWPDGDGRGDGTTGDNIAIEYCAWWGGEHGGDSSPGGPVQQELAAQGDGDGRLDEIFGETLGGVTLVAAILDLTKDAVAYYPDHW